LLFIAASGSRTEEPTNVLDWDQVSSWGFHPSVSTPTLTTIDPPLTGLPSGGSVGEVLPAAPLGPPLEHADAASRTSMTMPQTLVRAPARDLGSWLCIDVSPSRRPPFEPAFEILTGD
jgi:hypothetical protein